VTTLAATRLIDTTLREGEQFAKAAFRTQDKIEIARALDTFGVDYVEVTSPAASPQSQRDAARMVRLGLGARVITHSRCNVDDVRAAVDTGVGAIGFFFATSRILRESSHGKSIQQVIDAMGPSIELARSAGMEVRFSAEDAFRSEVLDLLAVYQAAMNMDRRTPEAMRLLLRNRSALALFRQVPLQLSAKFWHPVDTKLLS
jgi:homocitrate synthase